eukprot:766757-Hanusia_phi.AAC.1
MRGSEGRADMVDSRCDSNVGLSLQPVSMSLSPEIEEQVYFLIERTLPSSPARLSNRSAGEPVARVLSCC